MLDLRRSLDRKAALKVVEDLQRLRDRKGLFAYEIGIIYAALGDVEPAVKWFADAVRERSGWIAYAPVDPRLDRLREDRRYVGLFGMKP